MQTPQVMALIGWVFQSGSPSVTCIRRMHTISDRSPERRQRVPVGTPKPFTSPGTARHSCSYTEAPMLLTFGAWHGGARDAGEDFGAWLGLEDGRACGVISFYEETGNSRPVPCSQHSLQLVEHAFVASSSRPRAQQPRRLRRSLGLPRTFLAEAARHSAGTRPGELVRLLCAASCKMQLKASVLGLQGLALRRFLRASQRRPRRSRFGHLKPIFHARRAVESVDSVDICRVGRGQRRHSPWASQKLRFPHQRLPFRSHEWPGETSSCAWMRREVQGRCREAQGGVASAPRSC